MCSCYLNQGFGALIPTGSLPQISSAVGLSSRCGEFMAGSHFLTEGVFSLRLRCV
jgi:hypothetical protein